MKKVLVFLLCTLLSYLSYACPICGCGVGGFYLGSLPSFKSHFIGVRYQYSPYSTHINGDASQFSRDYYHTAELWGGISIGKKWQLLGFVPYHFNVQHTDDGLKTKNGLGDVTLLLNYKVWSTSSFKSGASKKTQELWLGAGAKIGTGTYRVDLSDPEAELGDVNSQLGTGSTDFIANAMYTLHTGNWGVNTSANYKINTANSSGFKFGNRYSANSMVYYQHPLNTVIVSPSAGVLLEGAAANRVSDKKVNETGGYVTLASAGLEVSMGSIAIGSSVQVPFAQNFAQGQTVAKTRALVQVTLAL